MSQFGASHAGAIERHQQRPSKQCSACVDQTGYFLPTQHRWQSTLVLRVRQEIAELMTLECLDKKEAQCRYLVDHSARRQLALSQQIGLVGSKLVEAEFVGRLAKKLGELGHDPQVVARGDRRIVAALEFLQHHLA
ncbi:MAG TPA: hypothetical protein VMG82_09790 [Candidatus Sulfotelmatobacter sp.]|nr:hypothetical protein [Candidatus Sulfotelmatobacter sp.]